MDNWQVIVGKNVRKHRLIAGLTQEKLAFEAQIDLTYVGGIERGKRNPSVLVLGRIANALGIEPSVLLDKKD